MTFLHAQQRRASAPYLNSRVGVGVGLMPTMDAGKDRLALAALCVDDTADRTGLRRIRGGDIDQPAPCGFELVIKLASENAPSLRQNGTVQPGLLTDMSPWFLNRTGGTGGHVCDLKTLQADQTKSTRNRVTRHMKVVRPRSGRLSDQALNSLALGGVPTRTALPTRQDALCPAPSLLQARVGRESDELPIGKAKRYGDTAIDANGRKAVQGRRFAQIASERYGPAIGASCECDIKHSANQCASAPEANPAKLWQTNLSPSGIQVPDRDVTGANPHGVVYAQSAQRRITSAAEEGLISLIQVHHRALKYRLRDCSYPIKHAPEVGNLACLGNKSNVFAFGGLELTPEISPLFESQVVDQPRHSDPLPKNFSLRSGGVETRFEASKHCEDLARQHIARNQQSFSAPPPPQEEA